MEIIYLIFEIIFFIIIGIVIITILGADIYTLIKVDWKHKWKSWIKEFCIMYIVLLLATMGINEQCSNMIELYGFTRETILQILCNSIIFTTICLPLLNLRNSKWI